MLGKRPRPNFLRTASKPQLMPSYGLDRSLHVPESKAYPQRVVIGFTIGANECRNPHLNIPCESPRSVLEVNALSVPIHTHLQKLSAAKSPRSFLGSLLSGSSNLQTPAATECGVGLGIVAAMEAEELAAADSIAKASLKSDPIAIIGRCQAASFKKREIHRQEAELQPALHKKAGRYGGRGKEDEEEEDDDDDDDEEEEEEEEGEMKAVRRSIFSAASPTSDSDIDGVERSNFLSFCNLCKRALSQANDIYMYRGDQAFCSVECRHQQMVLDDRKERLSSATAIKCSGATSTPPRHNRALAVAPAVVA